MKLFETNFSKEKPELIAAPVLLSTFKFQVLIISFVITVLLPFLIYEFYLKHEHHSISTPKHMLAKDINPTTPPIARGEHHIIANSDEKKHSVN